MARREPGQITQITLSSKGKREPGQITRITKSQMGGTVPTKDLISPVLASDELIGIIDETNSNDILFGSSKDDQLIGNDGDEQLFGESGNDTLLGGAGSDYLDGFGGGSEEIDSLTGGAGSDTFVIGDSAGVDYQSGGTDDVEDLSFAIISDFLGGEDFIQASGSSSDYELVSDDLLGTGNQDTGIYLGDDLIAVVENTTIDNFDRFTFVDPLFRSGTRT